MGRGSSGNSSGGETPKETYNNGKGGTPMNIETLKNIEDRQLYKEVTQGISRMAATLGMKERNIKLADIVGADGVQLTNIITGTNDGVYLNKSLFKKGSVKSVSRYMKDSYQNGHLTTTNKPVQHVITHELSHALWNSSHKAANSVAAGKEIYNVYKDWWNDPKNGRGSKTYGKYAATNRDEFFAEVVTKAVHGTSDKYTKKIVGIIKKHKLNTNV